MQPVPAVLLDPGPKPEPVQIAPVDPAVIAASAIVEIAQPVPETPPPLQIDQTRYQVTIYDVGDGPRAGFIFRDGDGNSIALAADIALADFVFQSKTLVQDVQSLVAEALSNLGAQPTK